MLYLALGGMITLQSQLNNMLKIFTCSILLIGLVSCLRTTPSDLEINSDHSSETNISTGLTTTDADPDLTEWIMPLLTNYLNDEDVQPSESITLSVRFSDEAGYVSDPNGIIYMQSVNISPEIACGGDPSNNSVVCSSTVYSAQNLSLITEDSGSHIFERWSGVICTEGQTSKTCTFELASNTNVVAHYQSVPKVSVSLNDLSKSHSVNEINSNSNHIRCQDGFDLTCISYYPSGSTVTLETEGTTASSLFGGWSGVICNEGQQANTCTFVVTEHLNITAVYNYSKLTVRQNGTTTDKFTVKVPTPVVYDPSAYVPAIYCDSDLLASSGLCEATLVTNKEVKLILEESNTYSQSVKGFESWSGVTCAEGQTTHNCTFTTQPTTDITLNFTQLVDLYVTIIDPMNYDPIITNEDVTLWCQPSLGPLSCKSNEVRGSVITLYADGAPNFQGWSGVNCTEGQTSATCTFTITGETQVTATYQ